MRIINIRESLMNMDRDTYCKYDLTTMYESLSLTEEKKKELVKYIDAYDVDATNKFLGNELSSQGLMEYYEDDDFSDEELASIYGGDTKYPDAEECGVDELEESAVAAAAMALGTAAATGFGQSLGDKVGSKLLGEDINTNTLFSEVQTVVKDVMTGFGFPEDEVTEYSAVEIKPIESGDMLQVEVRAELNYDDITELADKLDILIQKYDPNAYFEPVTSGIIEAFVSIEPTVVEEPDEDVVAYWDEKLAGCTNLDELREVYKEYREQREFMTDTTISAISTILDAKIDLFTADNKNESLDEGIFDSIKNVGNKIANKAKETAANAKQAVMNTHNKQDQEKKQAAIEYGKKDKAEASARLKDKFGGEIDINRAGQDEEELAAMDRRVSGDKIATTPNYAKNKKTTNLTGKALSDKVSSEAKKGNVYLADIGESLEEDYIDDDISFFDDFEYYDDEATTFIEGGVEYEWIDKRITSHDAKDMSGFMDTWYVASAKSLDDNQTYYFVIDDSDFIDWGPCDTEDEAREFVIAKDSDYDELDLDEQARQNRYSIMAFDNGDEFKIGAKNNLDSAKRLARQAMSDVYQCAWVVDNVTGEEVEDLDEAGFLKRHKRNNDRNNETSLSTEHAIEPVVDIIKKIHQSGGFEKLPIGRENALMVDIYGVDKNRLSAYFKEQPEFNYEMNDDCDIISHEFISDKYDIEVFDSFVMMYRIPQNESVERSRDTKLDEATRMTAAELKAKFGTDDVEIINAGTPEEDRVELQEGTLLDKVNAALAKMD